MYIDGTIRRYLDDASAGEPTPGGGSVAALAGALGMSMACMAANFTVGRKKYQKIEPEVRRHLETCAAAREELLALMDEDTRAYAAVGAAYGMPRETDDQRAARAEAVQQALRTAMDCPLRALRACRRTSEAIAALADMANPNLISDVGVAALLCEAALRAAKLNVEINLRELKDASLAAATRAEIDEAARDAGACARQVMEKVARAIGGTP